MKPIDSLLLACRVNDIETVKRLTESGTDINCIARPPWDFDGDLYSPIDVACKFGHTKIVKYLIDNGADVKSNNNFPIFVASRWGYTNIVRYLVESGVDVIGDNSSITTAVIQGHTDTVKYLLAEGADATTSDNHLVVRACGYGYFEIVKCLVEYGADVTVENRLAFRKAVDDDHLDIVKYLLDIDFDIFNCLSKLTSRVMYRDTDTIEQIIESPHNKAFKYLSDLLSVMGKKCMLLLLLNGKKTMCKDLLFSVIDSRYKKYKLNR